MEFVIGQPHLIDTLRFRLQASCSLPQDDIRIVASVAALVKASDHDEPALEQRIRQALAHVVKAEWTFTRVERQADASGYERVTMRAGCRVPASENWNLPERARAASGEGIAIERPEVSYSLSTEKVDAAVAGLRLDLLKLAIEQAGLMSEATGRSWRIGDIEFGAAGLNREGGRRTGKGAYSDAEDSLELLATLDGPTGGVVGGERITLIAHVTLKAFSGYRDSDGGYVIR
jgi:hypothetical protein